MAQITFVQPDGNRTTVEAEDGASVMQVALANGINGIVAECGGAMACATCHCYVDDDWIEATGTRSEGEEDMLDFAASEMRDGSRLSCQIIVVDAFDGLIVHLPEDQG